MTCTELTVLDRFKIVKENRGNQKSDLYWADCFRQVKYIVKENRWNQKSDLY